MRTINLIVLFAFGADVSVAPDGCLWSAYDFVVHLCALEIRRQLIWCLENLLNMIGIPNNQVGQSSSFDDKRPMIAILFTNSWSILSSKTKIGVAHM